MGYMGFGMNKEVYTRKPKKAFKKLKNIWGSSAKYSVDIELKELSDEDRKAIIQREMKRRKRRALRGFLVAMILTGALTMITWSIVNNHIAQQKLSYIKHEFEVWHHNINLHHEKVAQLQGFLKEGDAYYEAEKYNLAVKKYELALRLIPTDSLAMLKTAKAQTMVSYFYRKDYHVAHYRIDEFTAEYGRSEEAEKLKKLLADR